MDTLFIYGKYDKEFLLSNKVMERLATELPGKKKIGLCSAINFVNSLAGIQGQLEKAGYGVELLKGFHSHEKGQVLGCDMPVFDAGVYDAYLYVGDGAFHPKGMQLATDLKIMTYNPKDESLQVFVSDADTLKRKHKGAMLRFLSSTHIGVLISLKHGQNRSILLPKLKEKYPDKHFYVIVFDSLDFGTLEDFPFVDVWVNTMCPRIALDDTNKVERPIVNLLDVLDYGQL